MDSPNFVKSNHRDGLDKNVAREIAAIICSGELKAGTHLVETQLAKRLDVSQGTIRSAYKELAHQGLIELRPRRGAFVTSFSPNDVRELYTIRNHLEAMAAVLAAKNITPQAGKQIANIISEMHAAVNSKDHVLAVEVDFKFHELIFQISNHRRLIAIYKKLEAEIRLFMALTGALRDDMERMVRHHTPLADAIIAGDVERAQLLAARHNVDDGEALANFLQA